MKFREAIDEAHATISNIPHDSDALVRLQFVIARSHLFLAMSALARAAYATLRTVARVDTLMRVTEEERCIDLFAEYARCNVAGDANGAYRAITVVCDVFKCVTGLSTAAECMKCSTLLQLDPSTANSVAVRITEQCPELALGWVLRSKATLSALTNCDVDLETAASAARRALELEPTSMRGAAQLRACTALGELAMSARSLEQSRRYTDAAKTWANALALNDSEPFKAQISLQQGRCLVLAGDGRAAEVCESAAKRCPSNAEALLWLSKALHQAGQEDGAKLKAQAALALCEKHHTTSPTVAEEVRGWIDKLFRRSTAPASMPSDARSPHETLGVARTATKAEIARAYRRLALQWHPDKWAECPNCLRDRAAEAFRRISHAYDAAMRM